MAIWSLVNGVNATAWNNFSDGHAPTFKTENGSFVVGPAYASTASTSTVVGSGSATQSSAPFQVVTNNSQSFYGGEVRGQFIRSVTTVIMGVVGQLQTISSNDNAYVFGFYNGNSVLIGKGPLNKAISAVTQLSSVTPVSMVAADSVNVAMMVVPYLTGVWICGKMWGTGASEPAYPAVGASVSTWSGTNTTVSGVLSSVDTTATLSTTAGYWGGYQEFAETASATATWNSLSLNSVVVGSAGLASVSAIAYGLSPTITATAGAASVAATAYGPTATTTAAAGLATVTATAYGATPAITAAAGLANVAAAAYGATPGLTAAAGLANVDATAYGPIPSVTVAAGLANVAATAYDATTTGPTPPPPPTPPPALSGIVDGGGRPSRLPRKKRPVDDKEPYAPRQPLPLLGDQYELLLRAGEMTPEEWVALWMLHDMYPVPIKT